MASDGNSIRRLVEARSETIDGVISKVSDDIRNRFSEFDFMELCNSIHIRLNDTCVWCFLEELIDSFFKVTDVCPRAA